jgi:asparagine synthase (glutamine-hydrolysing)
MCGIGGIAWTGATRDNVRHPLAAMEKAMVHRGPDDGGTDVVRARWGTVGLCARRLAIQDLSSRGHQPMASRRSGSRICLNGEIYNCPKLRAELAVLGHRFQGHSDTEVVLAAYDQWGPQCFRRLRGMFAVAIWDEPGRRLVLARDRLGIKPLYYADRQAELLFASEIGALLASGLVPPSLSPVGVASYLAVGAVEEPDTIVGGVRALPPGHYGTWDGDRLRPVAYWSLADRFAEPVDRPRHEAVERVRSALEDAVRCHLVSDVPLGVFLSGGIDSSSLVGLVARVADPPQTVSVVVPQQRYSEDRYIRLVAERFATKHTQIVLDEAEVLAQVPAALSAMDQPTFDGVNTFIVSGQAARQAGLTVALAGVGGDELFAGYDTFRIAPGLDQLRRLVPGSTRPLASAIARRALRDTDRGRKLARWLAAREPGLSAVRLRRELFSPDAVTSLVRDRQPPPVEEPPAPSGDHTNRVSYLELNHYLRNVLLRDTDVMSMAHSLEVRVPFLDHELVELVAGLPGALKTQGSAPKPLLVEAVADLLPADVAQRPKMGFTLPFTVWLRGVLRDRVESALLDPGFGGPVGDLLDHATVREVWYRFLDGKAEWIRPWSLYAIKVWGETKLRAAAMSARRPDR